MRVPRLRKRRVFVVPVLVALVLVCTAPLNMADAATTHGTSGSLPAWLLDIGFRGTSDSVALQQEALPPTETLETISYLMTDRTRNRALTVTIKYPSSGAPYPLLVLAHGYAASASDYTTLTDEIARAGFVVVAPDFPLSSTALTAAPVRDYEAQAADVSFVIDQVTNPDVLPELAARIDPNQIAVAGHSDGGITAAAVAYNSEAADPRVRAAVILSGATIGFGGTWFTAAEQPALLAVHGTNDTVNPIAASATMYERATGTKMLVEVDGGSHAGPFMTDDTVPAVARLIADFLKSTLEHSAEATARLSSDASSPLVVAQSTEDLRTDSCGEVTTVSRVSRCETVDRPDVSTYTPA